MQSPETFFEAGTSYAPEKSIVDYFVMLNLQDEDVDPSLTYLDLGSGSTELFTADLRYNNITTPVFSLNPDYKYMDIRIPVTMQPEWEQRSVAAVAQSMPFKNDSFDRVVGLGSVTMYAEPEKYGKEITKLWLAEIGRILKPGGRAILAPIYGNTDVALLTYEECIPEQLNTCAITLEPVIDEGDILRTNDGTNRVVNRLVITKG